MNRLFVGARRDVAAYHHTIIDISLRSVKFNEYLLFFLNRKADKKFLTDSRAIRDNWPTEELYDEAVVERVEADSDRG